MHSCVWAVKFIQLVNRDETFREQYIILVATDFKIFHRLFN